MMETVTMEMKNNHRQSPGAPVIPDRLFFKIGDVAELADVKPYVLRYWETEFPMIAPEKSQSGQRVYRRRDVETVLLIKQLLYGERYSIEGARKRIRELRKDPGPVLKTEELAEGMNAEEQEAQAQAVKRAHGLIRDLRKLSQTPINKLFSL
jgi:DNA-binding transcriptional MerR regulator